MANLIRRHSMERLELYDLDKLLTISSPRKPQHRRSSINPTYERYQFLCNMTRNKTDPIYAATPMFTTIPQTIQEKSQRELFDSYIHLENVKPISVTQSKSTQIVENKVEIHENENQQETNDDDIQ